AGLDRDDVFITNVLKARPPGNRDPRADEVAHHWPWLEAQLSVIEPQLVVPLGRHALARFVADVKISDVHGRVLEEDGRRLFPMGPPGAALHALRRPGLGQRGARALGVQRGRRDGGRSRLRGELAAPLALELAAQAVAGEAALR